MTPTLRHILFVDDDPLIREIAELALGTVGDFKVSLCEGGEQVLASLEALAVDLIILDVNMPGMDGPEVLVSLKDIMGRACPPVIFLTAHHDSVKRSQLLDLGALAVLEKPFDPMTLADRIRGIWKEESN